MEKILGDCQLPQIFTHLWNICLKNAQNANNLEKCIIFIRNKRMFPTCRVSFNGLKSEGRYAVLMDIVPVDNKRYRYAYHRSCWLVAGKADPPAPARLYVHPDSPFTGDQLRKQVVSFEKVKLTNNDMDKHGQICGRGKKRRQKRQDRILGDPLVDVVFTFSLGIRGEIGQISFV
ncbi:T-box transcription factor TBX20 [Melipona quadrifasciata]|uniref:T-box transcription factor TBX20 n=1 Tax=Melipona quadrifasciata TaxID=166423 RepID=A0A0M9A9M7_9HYME|nr:T-box transcription factor TBX20 [Melipona quadrifasciata]